jgi:hypothetical protein
LSISALIRRSDQAAKFESLGVQPILFGGLDDLEACRNAASQSDRNDTNCVLKLMPDPLTIPQL